MTRTLLTSLALAGCASKAPPAEPLHAAAPAPAHAIYFAMVDRFANGDPGNDGAIDLSDPGAFHGGDLQGVLAHLDHIQALGFDTVWLSPVWKTRTEKIGPWGAYHGYWVDDPGQVEPRFGGEPALRALADGLHERDMRLVLDVVWNHVGYDAPVRAEHPDWFHPAVDIEDWSDPVQRVVRQVHGLPDLAQEQPEVEAWLKQQTLPWIDRVDADGFRVDAVRHMPLDFQARMSAAAHAKGGPSFQLIGEVFDGDPVQLQADWAAGAFDSVFDFPLRYAIIDTFCKGAGVGRVGAVLSMDRLYTHPEQLVTMLDNHDTPRVRSECGGDAAKVSSAVDLLLATRGQPSLTWGTEVGLDGATEPANRGDMVFRDDPLQERISAGLRQRGAHPSLVSGRTVIASYEPHRLELLRVHPNELGRVVLTDEPLQVSVSFEPPREVPVQQRLVELHLRGAPAGDAVLVGTGPELGNWSPDRGLPAVNGVATVTVPTGSLLELKWVVRGEATTWQDGPNRYVFVGDGQEPLVVEQVWSAAGAPP